MHILRIYECELYWYMQNIAQKKQRKAFKKLMSKSSEKLKLLRINVVNYT